MSDHQIDELAQQHADAFIGYVGKMTKKIEAPMKPVLKQFLKDKKEKVDKEKLRLLTQATSMYWLFALLLEPYLPSSSVKKRSGLYNEFFAKMTSRINEFFEGDLDMEYLMSMSKHSEVAIGSMASGGLYYMWFDILMYFYEISLELPEVSDASINFELATYMAETQKFALDLHSLVSL